VESEVLSAVISNLEGADRLGGLILSLRSQRPVVFIARQWNRISGRATASSVPATSDNRALDDFMRGRQLTEQMSPEAVQNGLNLLERAVSEDSSFALAYAAMANASITMMNWNYLPQTTLLANANSAAQTAVELDPNLPEALQARALVRQNQWNWTGARQDYEEALRLKPSFALARRYYAILMTLTGNPEEGVRQSKLAMEADPYDASGLPGRALILYISGRLEEAADTLEKAPNQGSLAVQQNLGETYALLGEKAVGDLRDQYFRKALEQAEKVRQLESHSDSGHHGKTPESDRMSAHFLAMEGKRQACQPWLERVEGDFKEGLISPAVLAWIYTALGRNQEALDLLERAVEERDRHMIFIKVYPFLNPLRSDVRFQRILTRMRLDSNF
jgi:tetratricopeptide (TPR) repeat protein